ncbi:hypothetical protein NBRC110019_20740 [Neptunitalea chrysea]|uniref:Uncharacterized protein n=2 Tax=Neptunitalea chrysea TaxID=1647581 RepID=A0A9W6B5L4_9FLAO|nr:hypothetical protein NBRC110019_20740 [Neptunitalea chrysea]
MGAFAQFPADDLYLFDNAVVKPKAIEPMFQKYAYENFYSELIDGTYEVNVLKEVKGTTTSSSYDLLVGKHFSVKAYHKIEGTYGVQYTLILTNNELGTMYYNYKPEYETSFELEFVEIPNLPADFYCKYIKEDTELSDDIWYHAEIKGGVQFDKVHTDVGNIYFLFMRFAEETSALGKTGFSLTLDDGTVIENPDVKIEVEVSEYGEYLHTITASLTEEEMKQICEHPIIKRGVATFKRDFKEGKIISEILKCLMTK